MRTSPPIAAAPGPTDSPFHAPLMVAVGEAYATFGRAYVSRQLEVCLVCCMEPETRDRIIATPVRQMPPDLIVAYSNSAHGVPHDLDDLRALMPRYLELLADDELVDDIGIGTELLRFGDAVRASGFLNAGQLAIYTRWAQQMVLHFGWIDTQTEGGITSPIHLLELLSCGGLPMAEICVMFDHLFAQPDFGMAACGDFAIGLVAQCKMKNDLVKADMFALNYLPTAERTALADWLNGAALSARISRIRDRAGHEPVPYFAQIALGILASYRGHFADASFPERTR
ncbi:hypothetical protein [Actibacterium sp. 188UL27-1]|uniref:hypothetical protein n=1 Tax=Actibacterium sp. 188UL27-1 TaxID=2786961 RepID=UPI00195B4E85|nr:hypothetical protein [Actibacterium sp. 188UL27-1]MBM7069153.1 hypothetical protein [Actibacterium sp. 188UL27-1]